MILSMLWDDCKNWLLFWNHTGAPTVAVWEPTLKFPEEWWDDWLYFDDQADLYDREEQWSFVENG